MHHNLPIMDPEEALAEAIPADCEDEHESALAEEVVLDAAASAHAAPAPSQPKRKHRAKSLTPKQAVTKFWNRGIFIATQQLSEEELAADPEAKPKYIVRCKCNPVCKTSFAGWDAYAYNRHFMYKKHMKWENMRGELGWDEAEAYREFVKFIELTLDDTDDEDDDEEENRAIKRARRNLDENTIDAIIRVEAKMRDPSTGGSLGKSGYKPEERRRQEAHYLNLWKEARRELRSMRAELEGEEDEEVRAELMGDIAGLKKRKEEYGKFLGIESIAVNFKEEEMEGKMEMAV